MLRVTLLAIDWPVSARLEGHFALLLTIGARRLVHFAGPSETATAATKSTASLVSHASPFVHAAHSGRTLCVPVAVYQLYQKNCDASIFIEYRKLSLVSPEFLQLG